MKISERLKAERAFVEQKLGDSVICDRCRATLATYTDACSADLSDACPGFLAVEEAKRKFAGGVIGE